MTILLKIVAVVEYIRICLVATKLKIFSGKTKIIMVYYLSLIYCYI